MEHLSEFFKNLKSGNKEACVSFCLDLLATGQTDIKGLYEGVLKAALDSLTCDIQEKDLCIWREHASTTIVRAVIECAYPYVIRERDARSRRKQGKIFVLCPEGETHEIGARMITDYVTILGFDASFVGSNTPKEEILKAVQLLDVDLIMVSITNYYNLVAAGKMIDLIRNKAGKPVRIIVGGQAFVNNEQVCTWIKADKVLQKFDDLELYLDSFGKVGDV